jgi:hypothetical protein
VTFKRKKLSPINYEWKVRQIAFDSQKHEKHALQAQNNIGLSEIGTY